MKISPWTLSDLIELCIHTVREDETFDHLVNMCHQSMIKVKTSLSKLKTTVSTWPSFSGEGLEPQCGLMVEHLDDMLSWLHCYLQLGPTPFRLNQIIIYPKWWLGHQERAGWPALNWMIQPAPRPIFAGESESEEGMIIASLYVFILLKWFWGGSCDLLQMRWSVCHWMWNSKETWYLMRDFACLVCSSCKRIITTRRSTKSLGTMTYDVSTGPIFHLDWGSEGRISIYCLCHAL